MTETKQVPVTDEMRLTLLFVCFLFVGCEVRGNEWATAASTHKCTVVEMEKAESEAEWCNENTDYFSGYCYGTAIARNCTKMQQEKDDE